MNAVALHERAREWGRALLLRPPWDEATERLSLLLVRPHGQWPMMIAPDQATLWMLIDRASVGSLPATVGRDLRERGVQIETFSACDEMPAMVLVARTTEGVERALEGVSRSDMETRWTITRAEPISDRLRRQESLAALARLLPPDGFERAVRVLWLDASRAQRGLWALGDAPAEALGAAGEMSVALLRIGCLVDEGAYPPIDELNATGRTTRVGQRVSGWLDDLARALSGDNAAARRATRASGQVLEETRRILAERFRDRNWLRDPLLYEARATRR